MKMGLAFLAGAAVALLCGAAIWHISGGTARVGAGAGAMAPDVDTVVYDGAEEDLIQLNIAGGVRTYDPGRISAPRESRQRRYIADGVYELEIIRRDVREERELWICRERERGDKTFVDCILDTELAKTPVSMESTLEEGDAPISLVEGADGATAEPARMSESVDDN